MKRADELLKEVLKPETEEQELQQPQEPVKEEDLPEEEAEETAEPEDEVDTAPMAEELMAELTSPEAELPEDAEPAKKLPYHERYYLRYHEGKRTTALDLDATNAFLKGAGFDGGELRQAREGKNCAETFREQDSSGERFGYCSYCGEPISGVDYNRTADGRLRCTSCSNSIVKTKEEAERLCQRVMENMETFFGASIRVPVAVEFMNMRKLKKKQGIPLGTRDGQSILLWGVAINKKGKYSILLENGSPRVSLSATFAHELTHIWQYTHWPEKKKKSRRAQKARLVKYEGMAKWAEIQYLYLIGATAVAKREEMATLLRQDEYGQGFIQYCAKYPLNRETMTCDDTPFMAGANPLEG